MSRSIDKFLRPIAPLISKAGKLDNISKVLAPLLSPNPSIWQVGNYEQGTLTLLTPDAAYATQLRFLCPHLLSHLRKEAVLPELVQIKIKVAPLIDQADLHKPYPKQQRAKLKQSQSGDALEYFEEGEIKDILKNIYANISEDS